MNSSQGKNFFNFKRTKRSLVNFFFGLFSRSQKSESRQTEINQRLVYTLSGSKIPSGHQFKHLKKFLNPRENLIIKICALLILVNAIYLGVQFYNKHLQLSPVRGGDYIEGIAGYPKTINPLYAVNRDVDSDLSYLIYSRLFSYDKQGQLTNDLVDRMEISADGKEYTLFLKSNVKWHNGDKFNANDVSFTFSLIQDPAYRSPLYSSLQDVSLERIDDLTIRFILPSAYSAFPNLLTFGILPQTAWSNITASGFNLSELNLKPIGSGPYQFKSLVKNRNGEIKEYRLTLNDDYYGAKPYIRNIIFKFFPDPAELVAAFNDGQIDGLSYLPLEQKKDLLAQNSLVFHELASPQINSIFLNQVNQKALADVKVRQALALAINKEEIVSNILNRAAYLTDGPILPSSPYYNQGVNSYKYDQVAAAALLKEAMTTNTTKGSGKNKQIISTEVATLELALTLVDTQENNLVAAQIKSDWEKIGVKVTLKPVPVEQVSDEIIHSKNYQALLYGEVLGPDPDVYAFWHSSQAGDKGLNLANYNNPSVDKLLEDGRVSSNFEERLNIYKKFQEQVTNDVPAIFLYVPSYSYVQTKKIKGFDATNIIEAADRFASINSWYLKTSKKLVW